MLRVALKNLWGHKLRLFTTALAVTLGVSFLTGTMVLTDTISQTFDNLFSDVYKTTDAIVVGPPLFDAPTEMGGSAQRSRVDATLVPAVNQVPGVVAAGGAISGYARLMAKDGKAMGNPANGAPSLGVSWPAAPALNPFKLVAGDWAKSDNEIVIDKGSATKGKLKVGDTTTVLVQSGPQKVVIAGIAKFGRADSPGGANVIMFTDAAAQRWVAEPGKFDIIAVAAAPGVTQEEMVNRLRAALPTTVDLMTGKQMIDEANTSMQKSMSFFSTFLLAFAVLAVVTGAFMIFNTFSITVAQRNRENGLLRALGASRPQVLASVLVEALVIGVVASALGIGVGLLVAAALKAALVGLGIEIPAGGLVLAPKTVYWALGVGVVATAVGAFAPARKAAKVSPIAAMHEGMATSTGYGSKERVFVGLGFLGLGVAVALLGVFDRLPSPGWMALLGGGLSFVGVIILGRTVALPMSRFTGWPVQRLRGLMGALARQNAMRNPKRTAATTAALMLCVTVVVVMNIIASSTRASINAIVDREFTGDIVVDPGGGLMGGVDHSLVGRIAALPHIEAATSVRVTLAKVNGSVQTLIGVDPATMPSVMDVRVRQGSVQALGAGEIAVYDKVANEKGLKLGDSVPVVFKDTGEQTFRVALIYGENQPAGNYFLGIAAYEPNVSNHMDFGVYAKKAGGVSLAAAEAAVKDVSKDYPGVKIMDKKEFKTSLAAQFNQLLGLVYVLIVLMVVIALLSIGTTLALSIFERTRELGLLRAVGMTRSQLRSVIRWESVIISVQGSFVGLALGVFLGWALLKVMAQSSGTTQFSLPITVLVGTVVVAAIAGVVAAVLPARRAAKLDVLRSVVTD